MVSAKDKWNKLSPIFRTNIKNGKIHPAVADNLYVLWPFLLRELARYRKGPARVLDYGCGCGGFCEKLFSNGYEVTGVDVSEKMIAIAKRTSSAHIKYIVGDIASLKGKQYKYDVVTAIMVMQFIKDVKGYIAKIHGILSDGGVIIIAVFNPVFIKKCIKANMMFKNENKVVINNVALDTFTRSAGEYKKLFSAFNFKFLGEHYPKFSKAFIKKYNWPLPHNNEEYMVMTFRKG